MVRNFQNTAAKRGPGGPNRLTFLSLVRSFWDSAANRGPNRPNPLRVSRSRMVDLDELERLMFAYKLLLTNRDRWRIDRFEAMAFCDELLRLCRSCHPRTAG